MIRVCSAVLALSGLTAYSQNPVAPTEERVGNPRGEDRNGYNFENSVETGYRLRLVGGDLGKYRSDVNYGNGVRLLSSYLAVRSKEGQGKYFDEVVLSTLGLGNDPYQTASLRIQKNRLYRYDFLWRLNEYYNPALPVALGQHLIDTSRRMQDHDLILLPDSSFRFFLGYSRTIQTGPALTTLLVFDSRGDQFPLFADIRREYNEFRLGNEFRLAGFRVNWLHAWANFKEDTPISLNTPSSGNDPSDPTTLERFRRAEPYHGNSPFWRVSVFRERGDRYAFNGRFTYTAGERAFVVDESVLGTNRLGAAFNRQVLTFGNARRPVATGNLNLSVFAGPKVTFANHTAYYNVRTEGDSFYRSLDNGTIATSLLNFRYLGIRTFSNQSDLNFQVNPKLGLFGGYAYSNRGIRVVRRTEVEGTPDSGSSAQTNRLNTGTAGLRWRPLKPLTFMINGEIGRANRPIFPTSERDYHALGARVQYRSRTLRFAAYARSNYNTNSASLASFSARSRQYAGEISWIPSARIGLDVSYSKLHLDTLGGIAYFASGELNTGNDSYYVSNLHHGHVSLRFRVAPRIDLWLGYSRVQDAGDGRSNPLDTNITASLPIFEAAQVFPLTFESPQARVSIRLHERLRWNVGYQYYGYREEFASQQDYRAHTGYISLLWSF